ncbi:MAG TPA: flagellar hook-associated protein FlgK [Alphaproteobacteria bacterium]|nr:flagellar hook-associated protein FlgK [Rhodospirillaceae bacterium]HRJ11793.1 flagellar hook-associated protein FlgK [Alphaproteobacteria bacterium]
MSIGALSTAIQGLNVAQRQLETIALNVANASTPGYTRKSLLQSTTAIDGVGVGVQTGQLQRTLNKSLQADLWRQGSRAASADVGESYLTRIQQLFGTPDSEQSFAATISKLKSGFVALSSDPSSGVKQSEIVGYAQTVVGKFNSMSRNIQNLRSNAESQILDEVSQLNTLAQNIADANVAIVSAYNRGDNPVELLDQRDLYVQELSKHMNITTFMSGDGCMVVQSAQGAVIADITAKEFSFAPSPMTYSAFYPTSANGILLNGVDITAQVTSGSVGKLFELRDTTLPAAQAMIDESAHKMALRFEAQGVTLFTNAAGNVPTDVVANYVGFSALMVVNPAVIADPSLLKDGTGGGPVLNANDNSNILKVIDFTFGDFADAAQTAHAGFRTTNLGPNGDITIDLPGSGNILNFANSLIAKQAQQYSLIKGEKDYEVAYHDTLSKKYQDETGVSIDGEMTTMITIQKSYSASARTITAVTEMFDALLRAIN